MHSARSPTRARVGSWIARGCGWLLSPLVRVTQTLITGPTDATRAAITGHSTGRTPIGSAVLAFVLTVLLIVPRLGTELIPQMSQGEFNVDLRLPAGMPLEATDRAVTATQRASTGIDGIALAYSVAGTGNRLDANPVDSGENTGRLSITLDRGAGRSRRTA